MSEKKGAWESVKSVFKKPSYWGGVIKGVVVPPLKALAKSSDATWDDSLVEAGEKFLDKLLPPEPPAA